MSCPELFDLLLAAEDQAGPDWLHARGCDRCRAALSRERDLESSLRGLRDPAPPAELLPGVLLRVQSLDAERRRAARQLAAGFALSALVLAVLGTVFGPQLFVEPLVDGARALAALQVAAGATLHALAPLASSLLIPVLVAQALVLLASAAVLKRFLVTAR